MSRPLSKLRSLWTLKMNLPEKLQYWSKRDEILVRLLCFRGIFLIMCCFCICFDRAAHRESQKEPWLMEKEQIGVSSKKAPYYRQSWAELMLMLGVVFVLKSLQIDGMLLKITEIYIKKRLQLGRRNERTKKEELVTCFSTFFWNIQVWCYGRGEEVWLSRV